MWLLRAVESSSAWVNDDEDHDNQHCSKPPLHHHLRVVRVCVHVRLCVLLPSSFSLWDWGLLGLPTQVIFNRHPEA